MSWLGRILWLLWGLLWRLVVLLLFEKWVPLPQQEKAAPPATRAKRKRRARDEARPAGVSQQAAARLKRAQLSSQFSAVESGSLEDASASTSSELSPELAAQREGEHWLKARRRAPASPPVRAKRENLGALLRDPRALRDAVVLSAVLGVRRPRS